MVELSDKEIAESFGKIALMFEDLKSLQVTNHLSKAMLIMNMLMN